MRPLGWFLIGGFALAVALSGIACYDDDYWDDDDYCHYDRYGYWHCHDDDDFHHAIRTDGVVIVLITDRPTEDVSAFYVTIAEVTLFEADTGPVPVYESETGRRLDLLQLRGARGARLHELLAVREIPSGVYASIRLTLRDPAVVLSSGEVLEGPEIDIAGKGQIDIDLAEQILLGPDETVHVTLDIDADASIGAATLSEPDEVRPVVLVDVRYPDVAEEALPRTDVEGALLEQGSESGVFGLELPENRGRIRVRMLGDSEILDRALAPAPLSALTAGSRVMARGLLRSTGELDVETIALASGPGQTLRLGEREHPAALQLAPIEGTVSQVVPEEGTLVIEVEFDGTQRTIAVSPDTTIVAVDVYDDWISQTSIPLGQIAIGADVAVHGEDGARTRLVVVTAGH